MRKLASKRPLQLADLHELCERYVPLHVPAPEGALAVAPRHVVPASLRTRRRSALTVSASPARRARYSQRSSVEYAKLTGAR